MAAAGILFETLGYTQVKLHKKRSNERLPESTLQTATTARG